MTALTNKTLTNTWVSLSSLLGEVGNKNMMALTNQTLTYTWVSLYCICLEWVTIDLCCNR